MGEIEKSEVCDAIQCGDKCPQIIENEIRIELETTGTNIAASKLLFRKRIFEKIQGKKNVK